MAKYRTAQGKLLDMGALVAKNETVRAVGNKSLNARGDTIDSQGKIIIPVTAKVNNNYNNTVSSSPAQHKTPVVKTTPDIDDNFDDEVEK